MLKWVRFFKYEFIRLGSHDRVAVITLKIIKFMTLIRVMTRFGHKKY